MKSGHHIELEDIQPILTDEVIERTGDTRTRILSRVVTLYDEYLTSDNPRLQYYLDLIKIRIALSSGSIRLQDAFSAIKLLEDDPEFVVGNTFGPIPETWSPEMIGKLVENLKILHKSKVIEASNVYSAVIDMLSSSAILKPPRDFAANVFSYFVRSPLASFSQAARDLNCHRSTIKSAMEKLNKDHHIMALSLLNGCHFGIKGYFLFFEMNEDIDWESIRDPLLSFPFTKTLHKVPTSPFGFVSFSIPGNNRIANLFRSSLERISRELFSYASIHTSQGLTRIVNPELLKNGEWTLPEWFDTREMSVPKGCTPAISSLDCPGYLKELTKEDFITSEITSYHLRKPYTQIAKIMKDMGYDMRASQIAYRVQKMYKLGVMAPWLWFGGVGLNYNLTIELVAEPKARNQVFEVLRGFPEVFTTPTDRGGIIWLDFPKYHLKQYYDFLAAMTKIPGVERIRPILAMMRSGGKNYIDIYGKFEFKEDGFSSTSSDVDIRDYLFDVYR